MNFIKRNIQSFLKKTPLSGVLQDVRNAKYIYTVRKQLSQASLVKKTKPEVIYLSSDKSTAYTLYSKGEKYEVSSNELIGLLTTDLYNEAHTLVIEVEASAFSQELSELLDSIISSISALTYISIVASKVNQNQVIDLIAALNVKWKEKRKEFFAVFSLGAYGKQYDTIGDETERFEAAIKSINNFKNKNIPATIGATFNKENVWDLDELLWDIKTAKLYGRFSIAEFTNNLSSNNKRDFIKDFTEDEKYHIVLFFYKLIYTFEHDANLIRKYKEIIEFLSGNANLHTEDTIANNRGDVFVPSYHYPITLKEFNLKVEENKWKSLVRLSNKKVIKKVSNVVPEFLRNTNKKAFIVGWYGTETVGDKAILAGIILDLQRKYAGIQIIVGSLFPHITVRTLKELNVEADIVYDYSADFEHSARLSDITIMGGGPLMDLDELAVPLHAFRIAHKYKKENIVYGCGLGPLYKEECIETVKEILQLSNQIMLRDQGSVDVAAKWGFKATLSGDFAKHYLLATYPNQTKEIKKGLINCYLREWTSEYLNEEEKLSFEKRKEDFERGLVVYLKKQIETLGARELRLQNMHNFVIGNDDRDFSRYFIDKYFKDYTGCVILYDKKLSTVESIVGNMHEAELNVCMRFHSVLFAHTLKTNFIAIDYTLGGKINNYLKDHNQSDKLISIAQLTSLSK